MAAGGLPAIGAPDRATPGQPAPSGEVASPRSRGADVMGRAVVARALGRHAGTERRHADAGGGDRAAVAGAIRDRVARLVAARAAGGWVARDLPRAEAAG